MTPWGHAGSGFDLLVWPQSQLLLHFVDDCPRVQQEDDVAT